MDIKTCEILARNSVMLPAMLEESPFINKASDDTNKALGEATSAGVSIPAVLHKGSFTLEDIAKNTEKAHEAVKTLRANNSEYITDPGYIYIKTFFSSPDLYENKASVEVEAISKAIREPSKKTSELAQMVMDEPTHENMMNLSHSIHKLNEGITSIISSKELEMISEGLVKEACRPLQTMATEISKRPDDFVYCEEGNRKCLIDKREAVVFIGDTTHLSTNNGKEYESFSGQLYQIDDMGEYMQKIATFISGKDKYEASKDMLVSQFCTLEQGGCTPEQKSRLVNAVEYNKNEIEEYGKTMTLLRRIEENFHKDPSPLNDKELIGIMDAMSKLAEGKDVTLQGDNWIHFNIARTDDGTMTLTSIDSYYEQTNVSFDDEGRIIGIECGFYDKNIQDSYPGASEMYGISNGITAYDRDMGIVNGPLLGEKHPMTINSLRNLIGQAIDGNKDKNNIEHVVADAKTIKDSQERKMNETDKRKTIDFERRR